MEDVIAKILQNRKEEITLPKMSEIDSKVIQSIAILSKRVELEPYLRRGFVYSSNNEHHSLTYYKMLEHTIQPQEAQVFTVIGQNFDECLQEAAKGLTQTEAEPPKKWEVYSMDHEDLEKIKANMSHTISTRRGILFSIHRTPLTIIDESHEPKTESTYRKKRLEVLKRNILKRYQPIEKAE